MRSTRKLNKTTANLDMSKRILRLKVVTDIVHASGKRCEKVPSFLLTGLVIRKQMHQQKVSFAIVVFRCLWCLHRNSFAIVVFRCFRKTQLAQVVLTEHLKHLKTD